MTWVVGDGVGVGAPQGVGDPLGAHRRSNGWVGAHAVGCLGPAQVLRWVGGCVQMWVQAHLCTRLDDGVAVTFIVDNNEGFALGGPHQGVWWGRAHTWAG